MQYLDTNIILDFLTSNDQQKQAGCAALFDQIEKGEVSVVVPDMVIAEVVYVLSSPKTYKIPRKEVAELITPLLQFSHLVVQNRQIVLRAIRLYADFNDLDFPDAYIVASMEQTKSSKLFSFDHDYDQFSFIQRKEPKPVGVGAEQ